MTTKKKPKAQKKTTARSKTAAARKKSTAKKTVKAATKKKTTAKKRTTSAKKTVAAKNRASAKKTPAAATKKRAAAKTTKSAVKKAPASRKKTGARKSAHPPARPLRRAIYIDVENTSSKTALMAVIESLEIDRSQQTVELHAVGNWRAVGQQVGRELAALGAQLVHSAPARGVRDWSDLWIAVAAGGWIARAEPGDILEIVSNDRAFDAVGDAAAANGVVYRRIPHRRGAAATTTDKEEAPARSRGTRRRRSRKASKAKPEAKATPAKQTREIEDDPHGATRDQMLEMVSRLAEGRSSPWVNLDVLESALKREGFSRPPNSPRLVTRLRRLKDFEVDSHGRVRVVHSDADA